MAPIVGAITRLADVGFTYGYKLYLTAAGSALVKGRSGSEDFLHRGQPLGHAQRPRQA